MLMTMLILFLILAVTRIVESIPWWSFVIPVMVLGVVIAVREWDVPCFAIGFSAGCIVWAAANLYFDINAGGTTLSRIALSVALPKIVLLLISSLIGGLLTGLALYTGRSMITAKTIRPVDSI